jgi:hypothetical protein
MSDGVQSLSRRHEAGKSVTPPSAVGQQARAREGIVAAAVEVMRAEGLQRLTMRRLAQELDTGAASL